MTQKQLVTLIAGCMAAVLTYLTSQLASGTLGLPPALDALTPVIVFALTILTADIRTAAASGGTPQQDLEKLEAEIRSQIATLAAMGTAQVVSAAQAATPTRTEPAAGTPIGVPNPDGTYPEIPNLTPAGGSNQ